MLFRYAETPHVRRHAPQGYQDYRSYKPWLRDEFHFRCVYCLCRERWFPDGDASFSVDHVRPRRQERGARAGYTQLVYACCQCNAAKQAAADVLDPWVEPFGRHVQVAADGTIHDRTPQGHALIQICRLDRPKLTVFRQGMLHLWHDLRERPGSEAAALRQRFFGAPENLPHLAALRPPGGNTRPQGIAESAYARQQRGESCPLA
jgi:hypothetical protein